MFVSSADGCDVVTEKYIRSVTYHLDETFEPSRIKVTKAPFLIARVGWGELDVGVLVEF